MKQNEDYLRQKEELEETQAQMRDNFNKNRLKMQQNLRDNAIHRQKIKFEEVELQR